mgnify:CR=1 FL=1|jgi:hypothetical protein|tara:strand:- start:350 stop:1918 length:1569 start_codon:yes stop_codon:yes gene_type:complete
MPFQTVSMDRFLGLDNSADELGLLPGQLRRCENYVFMANGGLKERAGGSKHSDPPVAGAIYGLSSFTNSSGTSYLICAQGTDLYYYDSETWNAFGLTLTASQTVRFEAAGFGATPALYACNGEESIIKIDMGASPQAALLTTGAPDNAPETVQFLKLHKNRLFGSDGADTIYFTDTLDFDTWNKGTNNFQVDPGINGNIQAMEVWGDSLFIFKEEAVYVLVNADASLSDFKVLKTDANVGTQSPDSVKTTKMGIFYFSIDGYVRKISPAISFSSNEFTLGGSGSPIVNYSLRYSIELHQDETDFVNVNAFVYNNLYILSFKTNENIQAYTDRTYFADTTKAIPFESEQTLQPMWGQFTGYDYRFFNILDNVVYGAKGLSGEVHTILEKDVTNDDGAAIKSVAKIAWLPVGGSSIYKRFNKVIVKMDGQTYPLTVYLQSYRTGKGGTPPIDAGIRKEMESSSPAYVGSATVGEFPLIYVGVMTEEFTTNLNGNYIQIQFENENIDEPTQVYGFDLVFRSIRVK